MKNLVSKELEDDFWNDCNNSQISSSFEPIEKSINNKYNFKTFGNNNYKRKIRPNSKYLLHLYSYKYGSNENKKNISKNKIKNKNKPKENKNLSKIYKKHPLLKEKNLLTEEDKANIKRKKNAFIRCLGLYAYGIEIKKEKILNNKNNEIEKLKEEISPCTFRPKISKYSSTKKARFMIDITNKNNVNDKYNINTIGKMSVISSYDNGCTKKDSNKNNEDEKNEKNEKNEECTFVPKINKRNIKAVFDKSKSLANESDNDQFMLRYNKAREDYMTKKIKQLSSKDEGYSTMLTEYNFYSNKHRKNKKYRNSNDFKSINFFDNKRTINTDFNIIQFLRNELLSIDLNDDGL